jgi:DNA-binding NarL/FixJ family response regulator
MKSDHPITVLLAEDHMVVREGLCRLLESESDIEVVGEAASGRQAVAMTLKLRPAVVVMDIAMPQMNGLEATRQIMRAAPQTKLLILSAHSDDAYVESVVALGAVGYLIKQTSSHFLCAAIREVMKGKTFFSPSVARRRSQSHQTTLDRKGEPKRHSVQLSSREMEVLQLIAEGKANKETAAELGIGVKTVEKHRDHLMRKLDIHDTAGLTRYAIRTGIIDSGVRLTIV